MDSRPPWCDVGAAQDHQRPDERAVPTGGVEEEVHLGRGRCLFQARNLGWQRVLTSEEIGQRTLLGWDGCVTARGGKGAVGSGGLCQYLWPETYIVQRGPGEPRKGFTTLQIEGGGGGGGAGGSEGVLPKPS